MSCPKAIAFNLCRTLIPLLITAALNIKIFHTIETRTEERNMLCPDPTKKELEDSKAAARYNQRRLSE
jgi:hypothetical protein